MRFSILLAAPLTATVSSAPLTTTTTTTIDESGPAHGLLTLTARQIGQVNGDGDAKFCKKIVPAPEDDEISARHEKFADAFLVKKDVRLAFTYIAPEYIVCLPHPQSFLVHP